MTALPSVVTADWVVEHADDEDVLLADVRGPNAHARGHLPRSIPLVVGAPGQFTDAGIVDAFAREVGLRLRRHGVSGEERLVLYDEGGCVAAACALQAIELAGHPSVAVLAGGLAAWPGDVDEGAVVLDKSRIELEPRLGALPNAGRAPWAPGRSGTRAPRRPSPRGVRGAGGSAVRSAPGPHSGSAERRGLDALLGPGPAAAGR